MPTEDFSEPRKQEGTKVALRTAKGSLLADQEKLDAIQALGIIERVIDRNFKGMTASYLKLIFNLLSTALIARG